MQELQQFPEEPPLQRRGHSCVTAQVGHCPHRCLGPDLRLLWGLQGKRAIFAEMEMRMKK